MYMYSNVSVVVCVCTLVHAGVGFSKHKSRHSYNGLKKWISQIPQMVFHSTLKFASVLLLYELWEESSIPLCLCTCIALSVIIAHDDLWTHFIGIRFIGALIAHMEGSLRDRLVNVHTSISSSLDLTVFHRNTPTGKLIGTVTTRSFMLVSTLQKQTRDFMKGVRITICAHVVQQAVIISMGSTLSRGVWGHAPPGKFLP